MIIPNQNVHEVIAEIPEGHKHLRVTLTLSDGTSFTFQEATVAAMVRAYTRIKTHPTAVRIAMRGGIAAERKEGYAEWQLLEDE